MEALSKWLRFYGLCLAQLSRQTIFKPAATLSFWAPSSGYVPEMSKKRRNETFVHYQRLASCIKLRSSTGIWGDLVT